MTDKNTINDVVCPGYPGLFYEFASKDINADCLFGPGRKIFCLSPSPRVARGAEPTEKREVIFSFLRVAVMKKGSAPGGELVIHIHRLGVYEYYISYSCVLFLMPCFAAQGLLQAGREIYLFLTQKGQFNLTKYA
jgi:hypothetical protein